MSWSVVLKAALAGLFVTAAAGILSNALLLAGVPPQVVRVLLIAAGVAAAAVVAGVGARRALRAGNDLARSRAHGVVAVALAGLFIGLVATLDPGVAVGLAAGGAVIGWMGARFATAPGRRHDPGPDGQR